MISEEEFLSDEQSLLLHQKHQADRDEYIQAPKDRYGVVFAIFIYLGVASLLPWNIIITAKNYFDYKFRNLSCPADIPYDASNCTTTMQTRFESYLSISSMIANLVFITIVMFSLKRISLTFRMMASLLPVSLTLTVTLSLVEVNTDTWQVGFFWFTLVTSAFMVGVSALMTGSVVAMSCLFPSAYVKAFMVGQAVGGSVAAVLGILSLAVGGNPRSSAFGYFLTAVLSMLIAAAAFFALYYLKFSIYYISRQAAGKDHTNSEMVDCPILTVNTSTYSWSTLKSVWQYMASICLVFVVSLACFPAVASLIRSVDYMPGDSWTDVYFSPVVCFLLYNLGDMIGRVTTFWVHLPRNGQKNMMLGLCALRVVFIPLLMICNVQHDASRHLPVLLGADAYPIIIISWLGLTNGYLANLSFSFAPLQVLQDQADTVGMMGAFSMVVGLVSGSILSAPLISLL